MREIVMNYVIFGIVDVKMIFSSLYKKMDTAGFVNNKYRNCFDNY